MYNCKLCHKKFTSKQRLEYHEKNQVCSSEKTSYFCVYCSKAYKHKQSLSRHIKKYHQNVVSKNLTKCSSQNPDFTKGIPSQLPHKSAIFDKSYGVTTQKVHYCCEYCSKCFTRKDNLVRHKKKYCEYIKNEVKIINNITNNITNITNNNTINNVININAFGKENIDSISTDEMLQIIGKCYNSVKLLLQRINIDTPENRNLYLPNIKDSFIYKINEDKKWVMDNLDTTLNSIKMNKVEIIIVIFLLKMEVLLKLLGIYL